MNNKIRIALLFVFSPFLTVIISVFNRNSSYAKNVIFLFIAFYGYTFLIFDTNADVYRHVQEFIRITQNRDFIATNFIVDKFYQKGDVIIPIIKVVLATFTDDSRILLLVIGLLFGFFFSRNVWLLFGIIKNQSSTYLFLLIILFVSMYPPWGIGAFRFPLASQVAVYGLLNGYYYGNKKYFLFTILSPLIHIGLIFVVALLFLHWFLQNNIHLYIIFLTISIIPFNSTTISLIKNLIPDTKVEAIKSRKTSYLNETYITTKKEQIAQNNWYATSLRIDLIRYNFIIIIFWMYFTRSFYLKKNKVLGLSILIFSVANVASNLASSTGRFILISIMLFTYSLIYKSKIKADFPLFLKPFFYFSILLNIIVEIRIGFYTITMDTIFSNPLFVCMFQSNISLDTFINYLK